MTVADITESLGARVVVVSPHLDDAILSLGATIWRAAQAGAMVEVVTVFSGNPESTEAGKEWDHRTGFATVGAAAARRRVEDEHACRIVGATTRWLSHGPSYDYCTDAIYRDVAHACSGADSALIPGFPLAHRDHAILTRLLLEHGLPAPQVALYVEQPYAFNRRTSRPVPVLSDDLAEVAGGQPNWTRARASLGDVLVKRRAIRAYASQLHAIGIGLEKGARLERMLWHEHRLGGEGIGFLRSVRAINGD